MSNVIKIVVNKLDININLAISDTLDEEKIKEMITTIYHKEAEESKEKWRKYRDLRNQIDSFINN